MTKACPWLEQGSNVEGSAGVRKEHKEGEKIGMGVRE